MNAAEIADSGQQMINGLKTHLSCCSSPSVAADADLLDKRTPKASTTLCIFYYPPSHLAIYGKFTHR